MIFRLLRQQLTMQFWANVLAGIIVLAMLATVLSNTLKGPIQSNIKAEQTHRAAMVKRFELLEKQIEQMKKDRELQAPDE